MTVFIEPFEYQGNYRGLRDEDQVLVLTVISAQLRQIAELLDEMSHPHGPPNP